MGPSWAIAKRVASFDALSLDFFRPMRTNHCSFPAEKRRINPSPPGSWHFIGDRETDRAPVLLKQGALPCRSSDAVSNSLYPSKNV
jgi:hypothetical protein